MKRIDQDVDISDLYLSELPEFLSGLHVNGSFFCSHNQLTSLQGAPKSVDGNFYCGSNPIKFTEEQVRSVCDVRGTVFVRGG